jgi:hypothetical protein
VLQRVRVQGCARGSQLRAGRKLDVRARGGRRKLGGNRGVRKKRIGSTAPRDTGSGAAQRSGPKVQRRGRRGRKQRGGIGRWEEGERGGADRWGRATSEREEGRGLG